MKREHVVIGGGIVGVCVAHALATRGRDVLLLERHELAAPSPVSSSGVPARMFRSAYGADRRRTQMCSAAYDRWRRYEEEAGEVLFDRSGWVIFDARSPLALDHWPTYAQWPSPGFAADSAQVLEAEGLPHAWLSQEELVERFPQINANEHYDCALLDGTAGLLRADSAVRAVGRLAAEAGAEIREHTAVERLVTKGDRVTTVITAHGEIEPTGAVVLAAGYMNAALAPELDGLVRIVGENTLYLRAEDPEVYAPDRFPVVGHYAFPTDQAGTVHVSPGGSADHEIALDPRVADPAERREEQDATFVRATREILETWIPALANAPVASQHRCYYPATLHDDYLLYKRENVVTLVACASGTGFKTAPVTAEIGAEMVLADDVDTFSHPHYALSFRPERLRA